MGEWKNVFILPITPSPRHPVSPSHFGFEEEKGRKGEWENVKRHLSEHKGHLIKIFIILRRLNLMRHVCH